MWALLAVTNIVDVLASRRAFDFGMGELNPFVSMLLDEFGILGVALFKAFWLLVLLGLLPYVKGWTQKFFELACVVYLLLTALHLWNLSPLL